MQVLAKNSKWSGDAYRALWFLKSVQYDDTGLSNRLIVTSFESPSVVGQWVEIRPAHEPFEKNDFLVSYSSAVPQTVPNNVFKLAYTFEKGTCPENGKDHGNVANETTGVKLRALGLMPRIK